MAQTETIKKKTVYIVTSAELGWDCVIGVYDPTWVSYEDLVKEFPEKHAYFIHEQTVETNLE